MINILEKFFTKIIPGVESFTQEGNPSKLHSTLPLILAVVVTEILLLFLGKFKYIALNVVALSLLTLLFKQNFLQIQWVGVLVIGLFFACAAYIAYSKVKTVSNIDSSPKDNKIDYTKIEKAS